LILLPTVSFAADGTVAITYFMRYMFRHFFREPVPPNTLAKAEAIDLSIQFILFWMPLFILIAWWTDKPLSLLFGAYTNGCIISSI
jgi:Ca2+:H+ antiporter